MVILSALDLKCLRPNIYCKLNDYFDAHGWHTLLLIENELLFSLNSWTNFKMSQFLEFLKYNATRKMSVDSQ